MITLEIAFLLFIIGVTGIVLNRKNILTLLMSIELMLLAINLILIYYSLMLDDIFGQLFAFFILVVAAAESAIGLSILVAYFRNKGNIDQQSMNLNRG
jgi:NADH-quinone oxidoreductase subunit K